MTHFVLEQLAHLLVELLLVVDLPLQVLNLNLVQLHGGRGDVANVRVLVIFGLFLNAFSFFNLPLFHFLASLGLKQLILLLLGHNNVTFGLISHINSFDLVVLALVDVFECEHCFLAHQGDLFVGPNFGAVIPLLLDLVL